MGRWLTPDPLGFADGPNLYAYVHNNPYKYFDPDGLTAWEFTKGAAHSLGYTAAAGMAFRGATAGLSMLCPPLGASLTAGYMAYSAGSFLYRNWDSIKHVGSEFMNKGFSSGMNEIGRGFNRKIEEFNQLSDYDKGSSLLSSISIFKPRGKAPRYKLAPKKPVINKVSRVAKNTGVIEQNAVNLNRFDLAASQLSGTGKNNIRVLRGWAKSKGWIREPRNLLGKPERWGSINPNDGEFIWNLRIKPEASLRNGLDAGSRVPRFDARLGSGGNRYINPFTGKIGKESVGKHIPLQ